MPTANKLRSLAAAYDCLAKDFSALESCAQACGNMPEAHRAADECRRCKNAAEDCERQAEMQEDADRLAEQFHGEEMSAAYGPMG